MPVLRGTHLSEVFISERQEEWQNCQAKTTRFAPRLQVTIYRPRARAIAFVMMAVTRCLAPSDGIIVTISCSMRQLSTRGSEEDKHNDLKYAHDGFAGCGLWMGASTGRTMGW